MIRITLQYLWSICDDLEDIPRIDATKAWDKFDFVVHIFRAESALRNLLETSVFAPTLRISRPLGYELLTTLEKYTKAKDLNGAIAPWELGMIQQAYSQFKITFLAELGTFPAYFVSQKGSHDTLTLLDQSWLMFPADLSKKVPEAMSDVAEAGKALCYETATACGFHLFRATESVLRRYYSHATGGKAHPKVRNIMVTRSAETKRCWL